MSVQITWIELWQLYEGAEEERRKEILQEARKVLLTLSTSDQVKALESGCPRESLEDVTQEMQYLIRRKYNVPTRR